MSIAASSFSGEKNIITQLPFNGFSTPTLIRCPPQLHQTTISGPLGAGAEPLKEPRRPDIAELNAELRPKAFITFKPAEPCAIMLSILDLASPEHL